MRIVLLILLIAVVGGTATGFYIKPEDEATGDLIIGISIVVTFFVLIPLFIPIMVALKLTAEGYVFYFQKRIGYKNEYFSIWKFATMLKDSPNLLTGSLTLRNDPRVTPVGKFLRISKINELC